MVMLFSDSHLKELGGCSVCVCVRARMHMQAYEYTWYCPRQGCLSDFCQSPGTRDKSFDM